jgi:hypothetical protein
VESGELGLVARIAKADPLDKALMFAFVSLLLSLIFALGARPLYRLLEGYTGPQFLRTILLKRQLRRWYKLTQQLRRTPSRRMIARDLIQEQLSDYPLRREDILPTRLGNAFRALETYGDDKFSLDSQTFWYELHSVAPDRLRQDVEDARAGVDFFISFVGNLVLLASLSLAVAMTHPNASAWCLALVCASLARVAYNAAVHNMTDFRYTIQALVNVGRPLLIARLGYELPRTIAGERRLWQNWTGYVTGDQAYLSTLDAMRQVTKETGGSASQKR